MTTVLPHHGLTRKTLPRTIVIKGLHEIALELWTRTQSREPMREWGVCMVDDTSCIAPGPECDYVEGYPAENGRPACVALNCRAEDHGESYEGVAHSHPPDETLGPYPGFSSDDYAWTLADGDPLGMVTNGAEIFLLLRVEETEQRRTPSQQELFQWRKIFHFAVWIAKLEVASLTKGSKSAAPSASLLWANKYLCEVLGFALYGGPLERKGRLIRIWP